MSLLEDTKNLLEQNKICTSEDFDQHFLIEEKIIQKLILPINKEDTIVEIGPGTGNITKYASKKAKSIIALEIDQRFQPILNKMPANVSVLYIDAIKYLKKTDTQLSRIIGNIPYQVSEPLMHFLCSKKIQAIITAPRGFAERMKNHPVFSAFLKFNVICEIPRSYFYPSPKIDSELLEIIQIKSPDKNQLIRQLLYQRQSQKLKNGLREALIEMHFLANNLTLTKKNAKHIIDSLEIEKNILILKISNIPIELYTLIGDKISAI